MKVVAEYEEVGGNFRIDVLLDEKFLTRTTAVSAEAIKYMTRDKVEEVTGTPASQVEVRFRPKLSVGMKR